MTAVARRAERAVFVIFALNGFHFANFAARVPTVRDGLGLDPQQMGLLLLVGSLGSLLALPLSGLVVQRLGAASTVRAFAVLNVLGLLAAGAFVGVGTVPAVAASYFVFCVGTSVWDSAMNLEGAEVERHRGVTIMPRLHAGFSLGTVAGAGTGALAAWAELPLLLHLAVILVPSLLTVFLASRGFLPVAAEGHVVAAGSRRERLARAARAWLEPRTLLLGVVVLAAALTEGAANDWMALAVVDGFEVAEAVGAVYFGVFVAAMTAGRFAGGRLLDRFGRVVVLRASAGLAVLGLVLFTLPPSMALAALGAALWGLGAAVGFPVGISAAADDPLHAASRVPVVATIGYSAFLVGPPVLGFVAQHVGYRLALLSIVALAVVSLAVAQVARPERERAAASLEA